MLQSVCSTFLSLQDSPLFLIKLWGLIGTNRCLCVLPPSYPQSSRQITTSHPTNAVDRICFIFFGFLFFRELKGEAQLYPGAGSGLLIPCHPSVVWVSWRQVWLSGAGKYKPETCVFVASIAQAWFQLWALQSTWGAVQVAQCLLGSWPGWQGHRVPWSQVPSRHLGGSWYPPAWCKLPAEFNLLKNAENIPYLGCFSEHHGKYLDESLGFPFCLFFVCFRPRFEIMFFLGGSCKVLGLSKAWVKQMLSSLHHCKSAQPPLGLDPKCSLDWLLPVIERLKEHFCSHQKLSGRVTAGSRATSLLLQEVFLYGCKRCLQN